MPNQPPNPGISDEQVDVLRAMRDARAVQFPSASDIREYRALDAALRTIEALPVTADGVRVVPGMKLYHCPDDLSNGFYAMHIKFERPYCCGVRCWDDGGLNDSASGEVLQFEQTYSTPEAAQAALDARGED